MNFFVADDRKRVEVEPSMGQGQSFDKQSRNIGVATPNARKRKAEKEKAEPFNWDTLRKQVQSKDGTAGSSREAMDSLDYEAMRNADVHEISEAIKERGMSKILAERMKVGLMIVNDYQ